MAYKIVKSAGVAPEDIAKREILIDSEGDLANIPEDTAPGSVAYTASMDSMYMKSIGGTWTKIGG